jgi:uncharacterized protein (DUF362 family)
MSRRRFLRTAGIATAGLLATHCQGEFLLQPSDQEKAQRSAEDAKPEGKSQVAIAQATTYDREVIRTQVETMLDGLGGLGDVISSGDRVAIKTNLTGGTGVNPLPGVSAIESYITHPEVVRALGELARDAGAREILIVEAIYDWGSYKLWGYEEVAEALDATLIDLNDTEPYKDFAKTPVPDGGRIYEQFTFNHILEDIDVFMSVSKMKCHWCCGVTHTMKNLIGLVPAKDYRLSNQHNHRSAFHGPSNDYESAGTRLPRIILDLNRARPIHFSLIDGIKTTEAGEGPWIEGIAPVEPGVLFAGKNAVATDAVATAAMGFDPAADALVEPFVRSDNHLQMAYELGLGTNQLEDIEIVGASLDDVRYEFRACLG